MDRLPGLVTVTVLPVLVPEVNFTGQLARNSLPDSSTAAGHNGSLVRQVKVHSSTVECATPDCYPGPGGT